MADTEPTESAAKLLRELLREIAKANPEAHARALGRGYDGSEDRAESDRLRREQIVADTDRDAPGADEAEWTTTLSCIYLGPGMYADARTPLAAEVIAGAHNDQVAAVRADERAKVLADITAQYHVPEIAQRVDGEWGVFCASCSRAEGDYVFPCMDEARGEWWKQFPPRLRALGEVTG